MFELYKNMFSKNYFEYVLTTKVKGSGMLILILFIFQLFPQICYKYIDTTYNNFRWIFFNWI